MMASTVCQPLIDLAKTDIHGNYGLFKKNKKKKQTKSYLEELQKNYFIFFIRPGIRFYKKKAHLNL